MKDKIFKNLVYSNSNIPSLAKYDRIKEGLKNYKFKKNKKYFRFRLWIWPSVMRSKKFKFLRIILWGR